MDIRKGLCKENKQGLNKENPFVKHTLQCAMSIFETYTWIQNSDYMICVLVTFTKTCEISCYDVLINVVLQNV